VKRIPDTKTRSCRGQPCAVTLLEIGTRPIEGNIMPVVRGADRPIDPRGGSLPTLQRLVDRSVGSQAFTVLVNVASAGQGVPAHVHEVEEALIVADGAIRASLDGVEIIAMAGDVVIVPPGVHHGFSHHGPTSDPARVIAVLGSPDVPIGPQPTPASRQTLGPAIE